MKKGIAIVLLACAWALPAVATQELETAVKQKDWPALAALFADDSHLQLASYFQECQGVGFSPLQPNRLVFYARFGDFAEIGELSFERVNGRYLRLGLKRTVKSLFFVRSFSRFPVSDRLLRVGDAEIHLRRGVVYRAVPMDGLFIFSGEMEFRIRPGSEEERLTLRALERSETFVQEARAGVFVLSRPQELLAGLPEPEPVAAPAEEEALALYEIFRKRWGMPVSFFDELWYFPFAGDFNAAIFHRRPGKSHFRYIFNSALSPDTSLVLLPENKFYLNYNAVKGLKFIQQGIDELKKLELNLFLNPQSGFLSATSVLTFKEPSNLKTVSLDPALVVKGVGRSLRGQLQFFQRGDDYFLMGEDVDKFSFYYAGTVSPGEDAGEPLFTIFGGRRARNVDPYFILNRGQNFYPNPGQHFFRSRVRLSLPDGVMGLASGSLTSRHKLGERTEFVFESAGTKGVSLVCGHFEKLRTIPGRLPIHIYGNPKLNLRNYVSVSEARDCLDFLLEKFGPLEISELNLLLRRQSSFGGWSNQGFVIFNLMENTVLDDDISMVRRLRNDSPVVFTDVNRDGLVHELAHQWWGGVVSWKSYQDQWLTEGLAQFSTLLYLENALGAGRFRRVLAGAKRWVLRKNDAGPVIYGQRIANLSEDLAAYQSIVYNKAALVFLMLKEMLGEEELLARLRRVLAELKYQSVATARFIRQFSQGDPRLQKFFDGWIYSRKIPRVRYRTTTEGRNAEIAFTQEDSDFVFPVAVRVTTAEGKYVRTLIVEEKAQSFRIFENSSILSLQVDSPVAPIELQSQ